MYKALLICLFLSSCMTSPKLQGPLQAGWNGKKVCEKLSENKTHNVLHCIFPPGVGHEKHQHNLNFGYALSGGTMQITNDKGTRVVELKKDSYFNSEGKKWHEVVNVGKTTVTYLIIEEKE